MRIALSAFFACLCFAGAAAAAPSGAIALYGDLKYKPGFTHFDYTDPDAPKGGAVKLNAIGTYDTFNPFTLKGVKADGLGYLFDTLMVPSADEPDTQYGLVAQSVEVAPDRLSVIFQLRPDARFHDGSAMTPADVIWTFDTLKAKGAPQYHLYYADVTKAEQVGEHGVKFTLRSAENRELPLILGELPVLSKKYWQSRDFEKTTLDQPLGSGPYTIASYDPGRSITYRLVPDYWAKDLPVNKGRFNFGTIRYDYYRDASVALEAFKAGQYDFRSENVAKNWAIGYACPALSAGLIKQTSIKNEVPQGMQGFAYNARRPLFQDRRVREALDYLFDFEWANKNLFYGAYTRTESYFSNSDLAASGLPGADELKLLEPLKSDIPPEVFTTVYRAPKTDGTGNIRDNIKKALILLHSAGWDVKGGRLVNAQGKQFAFEFLNVEAEFERILLPFGDNLRRIGIAMNLRTVDPAQYQNRLNDYDFDMTVTVVPESLSPGNEQRGYWTAAAADEPGGNNVMGVKSKAVDQLVGLIIAAPDRPTLLTRVHALDRVLLQSHYVIPNWHIDVFRVAYWDKFGRPKQNPPYAFAFDTWWVDPARDRALAANKAKLH
ncbi:MAG TPA: extracellular solute-binding protein [Stellaceae bacterium]|nr:extracellular solute-binding protein [Stellaceae bacterium]